MHGDGDVPLEDPGPNIASENIEEGIDGAKSLGTESHGDHKHVSDDEDRGSPGPSQ